MTYCIDLQRLIDNGYVDGELVYLQKLTVTSTMDPDSMFCRFCMSCGSPLKSHDSSSCIVVRNMIALNKLRRTNDLFFFNLEQAERKRERIQGDPDYPEPFRMYYCPYCNERYEYDLNRPRENP
jgi:hypothetical protein